MTANWYRDWFCFRAGMAVLTGAFLAPLLQAAQPAITSQPQSQTVLAGNNALFGLYAVDEDGGPLSYSWYFNGTLLPNQTNNVVYLPEVSTNHAGDYFAIVSNAAGSATSSVATLTVEVRAPTVRIFGATNVLVGGPIDFCADYSAAPRPTLQWQFNGVPIPAQTNSCLNLADVNTNHSGGYSVVASNIGGVATSEVVTVTVKLQAPVFVLHPAPQTAVEGATVTFFVDALAGPPATYFLNLNGTNLPVPFAYPFTFSPIGGFTLLEVLPQDAGAYSVIASNYLGAVTSAVATLTITPGGPLDRWVQRNPLPQSQQLLSIVHTNDLFVAVGERGTILTSGDGRTWAIQPRRVDLALHGVTYGAGQFVAVGDGGTILASPDGTNWTYRSSALPQFLRGITYGNGIFVAVGLDQHNFQQLILTSVDGSAWQRVPWSGPEFLNGVAFGRGAFVAVGPTILSSTNGRDWTDHAMFVGDDGWESVAFLNDQFVVVGDDGAIAVSPDGSTWTRRSSGSTRRLIAVAYGNGKFVTVGTRGVILSSPNTINWTPENSGTPDRLEAISFGNGLFVAAGENGTTVISSNATWARMNFGTTRDLDGMVIAGGLAVIVGKGGTILTSTNGVHYAEQASGTTDQLHGIGWGNGRFVAVGEPGVILTSSNGMNWVRQISGTTNSLKRVTYGNGLWVAVATQGTILTSPDAVTWTLRPVNVNTNFDLNDVAYGNGRYVAVGDGQFSQNGSLFTSADGVSWVHQYPIVTKNLRAITFANGIFLVTGNDGAVLVSTNGLDWSLRNTGLFFDGQNLRSAFWSNGVWVVVGNAGIILTSTNTYFWTRRVSRAFENLHGVGDLGGRLITIGNRGTVLQSDRWYPDLNPRLIVTSDGYNHAFGFEMLIHALPGRQHRLEASQNLVDWTHVFTVTNPGEVIRFIDPNARSYSFRFYRVIVD